MFQVDVKPAPAVTEDVLMSEGERSQTGSPMVTRLGLSPSEAKVTPEPPPAASPLKPPASPLKPPGTEEPKEPKEPVLVVKPPELSKWERDDYSPDESPARPSKSRTADRKPLPR